MRVQINRPILENLVRVGAFDSLEPDRECLLAEISGLSAASPLVPPPLSTSSPDTVFQEGDGVRPLPPVDFILRSRVQTELEILGLSVSAHPLSFYREALSRMGVTPSSKLHEVRNNALIRVAGLFERRQSPPTKSGQRTIFLTLEDEEGLLDVVAFEKKLPRYGKVIAEASAFFVVGRVQNSLERSRAILAEEVYDLREVLRQRLEGASSTVACSSSKGDRPSATRRLRSR